MEKVYENDNKKNNSKLKNENTNFLDPKVISNNDYI